MISNDTKSNEEKEEYDTTVVALGEYSFNYLKDELEYAFPGDNRKLFDYLAVYRTNPVSAITHYCKIKEVVKDAEVDGKYRLMNFGDKAREEATKVILEELLELEEPVQSSGGLGVQGNYYTKLEYLKEAKTLTELRKLRRD